MKVLGLLISFAIISGFASKGQTISGKFKGLNGEKIMFANVLVRDSIGALNIKEFALVKDGTYTLSISKSYKKLVLEMMANGFEKGTFMIDSFNPVKNYVHDFWLVKKMNVNLQEVTIKAKQQPIKVRGDTVSYLVSAYTDASTRKIQDVLKKMPGIEVNDNTGEIKYKGKTVSKVKLDGDDLFGNNYAIGTKNINVGAIQEVQAIENYLDNPLLKGIENSQEVALNLTLKKKGADISGGCDFGLGLREQSVATDLSSNLLAISKKYKSFASFSYNNSGKNYSPDEYFSAGPSRERAEEFHFLAGKYIPETYFNSDIDPMRSTINNATLGSYNAIFKVGKNFTSRANLYYLTDKLNSEQSFSIINNLGDQSFRTTDQSKIKKLPVQYRGDLLSTYQTTKSLLEYKIHYKLEQVNTDNILLQDSVKSIHTQLHTTDNYFKQKLTYTLRLSEKNAVQIAILQSANDVPQDYIFEPALFSETINYQQNKQLSAFKKNYLSANADFLGKSGKNKYKISIGTESKTVSYNSDLKGVYDYGEQSISGFGNDMRYKTQTFYSKNSYNFQFKNLRIFPKLNLSYLNQHLANSKNQSVPDSSALYLEPSLTLGYKPNSVSILLLTAAYNRATGTEEYLVENPVYVSNRLLQSNKPSLNMLQVRSLSVMYLIFDMSKQYQLEMSALYSKNKGNFYANMDIQQSNTRLQYYFMPDINQMLSVNFMVERYIDALVGTIKFKSNYFDQKYKNVVNNSQLRNNRSQGITSEFEFRSGFDIKFNFENKAIIQGFKAKSEASPAFTSQSFNNKFQCMTRVSKSIVFKVSADYIVPNTNKPGENLLFIDSELYYFAKNKLFNFRVVARNLTNNKLQQQIFANDYSTTIYKTNLMPRYFMLAFSVNL